MTEEEMIIEATRSMMENGLDSPRRTDLIWKIRSFMVMFALGDRTPGDLIKAMDAAGLKIEHAQTSG